MKVIDVIKGMANETVSRKQLAEDYDITTRTISNKIKGLGYVWDKKEAKHYYQGDESKREAIENTEFATLFEDNRVMNQKKATQTPITVQGSASKKVSVTNTKGKDNNTLESNLEGLDSLFKEKKEKVYKGFYVDSDVAEALEQVPDGNKSKLVSEALRLVFEGKGIL